MAILTSDANIPVVSVSNVTDLMRSRGSTVSVANDTVTNANFSGRNRGNTAKPILSTIQNTAFPIRKRGSLSLVFPLSLSTVNDSASIPPRTPPSGKLSINGQPLHMGTIPWGNRQDILFSVVGGKLTGLSVEIELQRLNGEVVFSKRTLLSPGGVIPSPDITLQPDGEQAINGWIIFMPADSLKIASGTPLKPIELKYFAHISNNQSRKYLIEQGRVFIQ